MSTIHHAPTPGVTLAAVEALRIQQTFTREQVAYLMALAYESGRAQAAGEDLAETIACWTEHPLPSLTREQRVAQRMAEMDRLARAQAAREGRPYRLHPGGPVDWETGEPVRHLLVEIGEERL